MSTENYRSHISMELYDNCYCCPRTSTSITGQSAMDLDSALSELGMLSSVTDSRREFLNEKERQHRRNILGPRGRNLSEPSLAGAGTPSNSPTKGVYQIVQINSQFVTSLSTGLNAYTEPSTLPSQLSPSRLKPDPNNSVVRECLDFGERYKQEELEQDARANRIARLKVSRVKRFRKPYELPWRQTLEQAYMSKTVAPMSAVTTSIVHNQNQYSSVAIPFLGTPEKVRPADKVCNSNASTPEKNLRLSHQSGLQSCMVTRSKSLDDLDLTKLQLAETENHNFIQEKKDIETVSQHLQDLHVQE